MAIVARISFTAAAETRVFEIFNGQITAQSSAADVDLYGSNMPTDEASWQSIGTVVGGYAPASISTGLSHIKAVAAGATVFAASDIDQAGTGGGGGGGGGAVTIADGADVTQGARAQTAATDDTGTWSIVQLTKRGLAHMASMLLRMPASLGSKAGAQSLSVTEATGIATSIAGTVTTGGTAQQLAAANTARRGLTMQNTSTGELRVSPFGTASATAGYRVSAGDLLVLDSPHCGVGAVSIWGATTGQTFVGGEAV